MTASGVDVPTWIQQAQYFLHPQWEGFVKLQDRFEEAKGHSDALYIQYENLSRKAQSKNASTSTRPGKGGVNHKKERDKLRGKTKSVLHHLEDQYPVSWRGTHLRCQVCVLHETARHFPNAIDAIVSS